MGAYMYPIVIKHEPQKIPFTKTYEMESGILTLSILRKYVKNGERFTIDTRETGQFGEVTTLTVYKKRKETKAETRARVVKEIAYMNEYNRRQRLKSAEFERIKPGH